MMIGVLSAALCLYAQNPATETPAAAKEAQGIPPRATAADYQFKAQAGTITIAAEFLAHSVPTPQGTFTSEDYVVVEAALFGPAGSTSNVSASDFSLRINGKKAATPGAHFALVFHSLKDPEWVPPGGAEAAKSKTSVGGAGGGASAPPPSPPKMPFPLKRAMEQKVQKAALPEGERALPQAGLLFFPYRGKPDGIHAVELTYTGKDGKVTMSLQ